MDAQTRPKRVTCTSHFPPHRPWMRLSSEQLRCSLGWLHEQVRLDLMRDTADCPNLRLTKETATFGEFESSLNAMWTHRRSGMDDLLQIAVYEVCEVGNPANVLVHGELEFVLVA
jgi:hypothetical protein